MLMSSEECKKQWDPSGSEEGGWRGILQVGRGFFKWERASLSGKGLPQVERGFLKWEGVSSSERA